MVRTIVGLSNRDYFKHAARTGITAVAVRAKAIVEVLPTTLGVVVARNGGLEVKSGCVLSDHEVITTHGLRTLVLSDIDDYVHTLKGIVGLLDLNLVRLSLKNVKLYFAA